MTRTTNAPWLSVFCGSALPLRCATGALAPDGSRDALRWKASANFRHETRNPPSPIAPRANVRKLMGQNLATPHRTSVAASSNDSTAATGIK
eukprot:CAMPEP_0184382976 /NCGR_PEP_ID=MMETSP0007-20130409/6769_1 /TAXON_ID=97485 /ORGANISM="Prymnesium parvum, Strain Texoma1" /LENGTH=91 /DNA_ID=CAMNT_0026729253 /DNA_START=419 /DNA_END=694 /DNA_ORIENTATION=+